MEFFNNPFDIEKDGSNDFIDGIRYHIRESENNKEKIKEYINNNFYSYYNLYYTPNRNQILDAILNDLNISYNDLTIVDEHELLDYITCQMK